MSPSKSRRPPRRGEVWMADLDPARGHEQAGDRPVLVVSNDEFNRGRADLATVLAITETNRGLVAHVPIDPPEGGLRQPSVVQCEQIRTISLTRFGRRMGLVHPETMETVDDVLRMQLDL